MNEEQYTIPQPDIQLETAPEVPTETLPTFEMSEEVQVVDTVQEEPSGAITQSPVETAGVLLSQEQRQILLSPEEQSSTQPVTTGICESTGVYAPLYAVRHHQAGNPHIWLYSEQAKASHEREYDVVAKLKEVALTHPAQADTPRVATMLHQGRSVDDVKAQLDRERQPELEAEVVTQ